MALSNPEMNNGLGDTPIYKGPEDIKRRLQLASETELVTLSKAITPEIAKAAQDEMITRQGGTPKPPKTNEDGTTTEPVLTADTEFHESVQLPNIFQPEDQDIMDFKLVDDEPYKVPEPAKTTPNVSYVVENITGQPSEDNALDEERAIEMDKLGQETRKSDIIKNILNSLDDDVPNKVLKAKQVANQPPLPKTVGTIFTEKNFPSLIGQAQAQEIIDGIDQSTVVEKSQAAIAAAFNEPDYNTFLEKEGDYSVYMSVNMLHEMLTSDYGKAVAQRWGQLNEWAKTSMDAKAERRDKFKKEFGPVLGSLIANFAPPDDPVAMITDLATQVTNMAAVPFTSLPLRSPKEYAAFISMVPNADSPETDKIALEFLQHLFDPKAEGYISPDFKRDMEKRYGPDWGVRMSAFMMKEIGVDAALLSTAGLAGADSMFAGATASLKERFMAAIARASVLSVGGGSVQASLNTLAGQDHNDLYREMTERFVAGLVGEGVIKAVSTGFKALFRSSTEAAAKAANLPLFKPAIAQGRAAIGPNAAPVMRLVMKATLNGETKLARDMAQKAANAVSDPSLKDLRANLSKLTGIPENELDMTLGLGNSIYGERIFAGIPHAELHAQGKKAASELADIQLKAERTAADAQKAVDRLQKYYEKRPITSERGQAARDARLAALNKELADAKAQAAQAKTRTTAMASAVKALEDRFSTFTTGSELADKVILGDAVGLRVMAEMGSPTARQDAVNDVFYYLGIQDNTFQFRPREMNPGGLLRPITRYIGEPHKVLPEVSIPQDLFEAHRSIANFSKMFERAQHSVWNGLNSKSRARVLNVLEEGSDQERVWSIPELQTKGLNPEEVDAYYAQRKILDMAHMLNDATLTRELAAKGYKQMADGTVVKPTYQGVSAEQRAQGLTRVIGIQRSSSKEPIDMVVKEAELREPVSVLGYHTGYIPIAYKDARWHVSVIDTKKGTVRRLDGFPSHKQAKAFFDKQALRKAQEQAVKDGDFDPNEMGRFVTFYGRWNDVAKRAEIGFDRGVMNFMDTADDATITKVRQALRDNPDIEVQNLKVAFDKMSLASLKRKHAANRAEERLSHVDPMPSEEAIAEYLQATAFRAGTNDWRAHAIDEMVKIWGPEGKNILGPNQSWDTAISRDKFPSEMQHDVGEFIQMQDWLKKTLTFKTKFERQSEGWFNGKVQQYAERGKAGQAFASFLDSLPDQKNALSALKGIGFITKLGLFNASQLYIQASQAALTAGANILDVTPALRDMSIVSAALAQRKLGARLSKEQQQILGAVERSGYLADLSTTDMVTIMGGGLPALERMRAYYGMTQGTVEFAKKAASKGGAEVLRAGNAFIMAGEALNRSFAFLANRQRAIRLMKSGKFLGRDGKPFKGAIDDPEFLQLVADRAQVTALNMQKSGEITLFSGWGSLGFQFKQVAPKTVGIFTSKQLSPAAKLGAAAAGVGLLGPQAIPYLIDLWNFADWTNYQVNGKTPDERQAFAEWRKRSVDTVADYVMSIDDGSLAEMGVDKKFIQRLLHKGSLFAMSDGEIDLVNRLALGKFVEETMDYANTADLVPILSVMSKSLEAGGNIVTFLDNYNRAKEDNPLTPEITGANVAGEILRETGKVVSSAGYLSRFLDNAWKETFDSAYYKREIGTTPTITSSSGQDTEVPVTKSRLFQYLVGLTPGKITARLDLIQQEKVYKDAIEDYMKRQVKNYALYEGDSRAQRNILNETYDELLSVDGLMAGIQLEGGRPRGGKPNWIATEMKRFSQYMIKKHNGNSRSTREN